MATFIHDLRYTLRTLLRSPVFTSVAVLTLAIGIGANSAIFSVVNGVILQPLRYRAPEHLVMISTQFPGLGFDKFWVSAPEYMEFREWNRSFDEVAIYNTSQVSISSSERPLRAEAAVCTAELFHVLGVGAMHGRVFTQEEDLPGGEAVIVLSYELWQNAFAGDLERIGEPLEVDGIERILVGVMPPGFDIDDNQIEAWIPLGIDPANPPSRSGHNYYMVGRLDDGVTLGQARAELETLLERWPEEAGGMHSPNPEGHRMIMESLHEEMVGETRPALMLLLGAVGFVLLVACANVGNLLLARAESRQKEIAVRTAIGAGRGRLVRQFLTESVALALMGGVLGLAFAYWGIRLLLAANPGSVPRAQDIALDGNVVLFTLVVSIFTGILFGLAPLLHMTGHNLGLALKEGGQRATAGSTRHRLRRLLVIGEVALAFVLVIGSGLMLRSFRSMQQVDPGFNPEKILTFQLYLPPATYPESTDVVAFYRQITERISSLPGVEKAAAMTGLPPRRRINANTMQFEGLEQTPDGPPHNVDYWQFVTQDYFETMNIPLVAGRFFSAQDAGDAPPVVLINETTAKVFWPDKNPIGRRLRPPSDQVPWFTVVGIVKDVKQGGLGEETGTECYFFHPQVGGLLGFAPRTMNLIVRSELPFESAISTVRSEIWSRDASLPLAGLRTMEQVLSDSLNGPRFMTLLLALFGIVALSLAAVGTYGVMSYSVAERTNEIGIRMAMGASSPGVVGMVLANGLKLTVIGLGLGFALAIALTRLLSAVLHGLLFEVNNTDWLTFSSVPLVLLAVSASACLIPAYRAARIPPVQALRYE